MILLPRSPGLSEFAAEKMATFSAVNRFASPVGTVRQARSQTVTRDLRRLARPGVLSRHKSRNDFNEAAPLRFSVASLVLLGGCGVLANLDKRAVTGVARVDILTAAPAAAARQASVIVPIVFVSVTDPVAGGLLTSFAHPGGNLTGITGTPPTTFRKELEILNQLRPQQSRVAIIADVFFPGNLLRIQATSTAANGMRSR
jgi:hypothetical protein